MINKRNIVTVASIAVLMLINGISLAENSNDLLRMDIKKSAAADSVDVTFYTTGGASDSIVTRKSETRYVVLLPDVAGSQSVVPSLGAVKDLITDISVKNVDDKVGGYTKVTFSTTKPVKIQTYTKKTSPLTQAQQDYKNLLASNSKPAIQQKPKENNQKAAPVANTKVAAKPTTSEPKKVVNTSIKSTQSNATSSSKTAPAAKVVKPVVNNANKKPENKAQTQTKEVSKNKVTIKNDSKPVLVQQKPEQVPMSVVNEVKNDSVADSITNHVPKMKFDKDGKRTVDLEPKVKHNIEKSQYSSVETSVEDKEPETIVTSNSEQVENQINTNKNNEKSKQSFPFKGLLSVLGIISIIALINSVFNSKRKTTTYKKNVQYQKSVETQLKEEEYDNIINDDTLNWQEKYKLYSEKEENIESDSSSDYSFVTNMGASQNVVTQNKNLHSKLQAKISQMEHALAQTPNMRDYFGKYHNDVISEDNQITGKMESAKLKSFAKTKNLSQTNRDLLKVISLPEEVSSNKNREKQFVELRNSALNASRRNSLSSRINISDLTRSNNIYDNPMKGAIIMPKTKKSKAVTQPEEFTNDGIAVNTYSTSSINEYLDILGDDSGMTSIEIISSPMASMNHSKMIVKAKPHKSKNDKTNQGLEIRDKYTIDEDKSIYLVDLDGQTSIVSEVHDEISVIKQFDKIVNKQLQVRHDYGNVYIVRVGSFKCLVDVSEENVKTLLEI